MMVTDPVCKMTFPPERAAATYEYDSKIYYFCNPNCKAKFSRSPELYLSSNAPAEPCCCCAEAFEDDDVKAEKRLHGLLTGFIIAAAITALIMVLEHWPELELDRRRVNYLEWGLSSIAVFGPGGFLLLRGVKSLKNLKLNMFTLICMGIGSAYFYSVYALFFAGTLPASLLDGAGNAKLHFAPAAMIAALVILGQYLEGRASRGAGRAIKSLMELVPPVARRVKKCCGTVAEIPQLNFV